MGQYTSYYLYQKYVKYGSQDWLPAYPNEYSISGDGTNPLVIKSENDVECGYIPPSQPIYRWVNLPIETDYICDETPAKLFATYSDSRTYSAECDSETTLTTATTRPSGYDYSAMTSAVIGDCITSIGESAFEYCSSLTSADIPNSVTSIGMYAFNNCRSLSGITIPSGVTQIGSSAFRNCSGMTSCTIGSGITSIGGSSFYQCSSLTGVTIQATTPPTLVSWLAFRNTNNCPIYVPCDSVSAYKAANQWNRLANRIQGIPPCGNNKLDITIESGTTYSLSCDATSSITQNEVNNLEIIPPYGDYSMDIQISDCVSTIGNSAFYNFGGHGSDAGSMKICIPDTVTSIGDYAFYCGNKSASRAYIEATIGSGITSIGSYAFLAKSSTDENMRGIGTLLVTINATTPPTIGSNPFSVTGTTGYVYLRISVPAASVNTYKSAWPQYASNITAIS